MPEWTSEQQLAIDKENTNIIVSAGAGSGKTAVLTARVIRKLKMGININELLVLTFTNKAAHEMKERIREAIEEDKTLIEQLDYLDNSYITTFDSFALSVVKKYSDVLNISKNVKIADSSIIYLEKKRIIDNIFNGLYENKDYNFLKLIDDFTVKDDKDIKNYILTISDKLDLKYDKSEYLRSYVETYYSDSNIHVLVNQYLNIIYGYFRKIKMLLDQLGDFVDTDYFLELSDILDHLLKSKTYDDIKRNFISKLPNLPRGSEDDAKNIKKKIGDMLSKIESMIRFDSQNELIDTYKSTKQYILPIISIIEKLDEEMSSFKSKNSVYEFTDISKMAIKILKENDEVKEELKYFFKEIMIDEYQDTSDLQEEFISMIENNNIYMVGDIKQSIYRFRNANPYLFKNKYDMYSVNNGGFKIDLTKNFRSRKEVIDNVNRFFENLMNDNFGGADYKTSHEMIFGNMSYVKKGTTKHDNNIEIFNYEYDKTSTFSKEEIEIFFIARNIKEKINEKYQIFDKNTKALRDARFGDFSILLDKSSSFELYKKIFEYLGIPMTKYTTTNITNEIEIILVKNILKLIISNKIKSFDEEFKYSFVSIARSYLFSYDDQKIFDYISNNNYFDSDIMKIISEISSIADSLSLGDLIIKIIESFDFYAKQILVGDVKNRLNRLSSIIDIFNSLSDLGYDIYSTYEYLNTVIEDKYKLEVKDLDVLDNSVKIMTIHASKGLEFSVCYFAGLHSNFNIRELNEKFLYNNKYGIVSPYFKEGIGKAFIKDLVKSDYVKEEISEKIRLFYVALTRAKEKLIVVTSFDDEKKCDEIEESKCFLDMILYIKDYIKDYIKELDVNSLLLTKEYSSVKKYNYKDAIKKSNESLTVSSIELDKEFESQKKISKIVTNLIDDETRNKLTFGIQIHETLEHLDFKNPNFDDLNIPSNFKKNIEKLIKDLKISESLNIYKEYEFIDDNPPHSHGIIDLVIEYDDCIKIVDYKLKNIDDDNYRKQVETYKLFVSKKTKKNIETYLFSIIDGIIEKVE